MGLADPGLYTGTNKKTPQPAPPAELASKFLSAKYRPKNAASRNLCHIQSSQKSARSYSDVIK